jgi:hypothetical protein
MVVVTVTIITIIPVIIVVIGLLQNKIDDFLFYFTSYLDRFHVGQMNGPATAPAPVQDATVRTLW